MSQPPKQTTRQREVERVRDSIRRTVALAHTAIDALDVAGAIAHARSLRSVLWRAENAGIDPTALTPDAPSVPAPDERN